MAGGEFDGAAITPGSLKESAIIHRISSDDPDEVMPPKGDPVTPEEAKTPPAMDQGRSTLARI